ncbi:fibroblast growth factor-binding protein 2 [Lacerta agilis]|uniref:fibroblast growth factor-binding protein 2 n=1 Tax=Lacerta agilis TaxID=80427 RepID=UPI001419A9BD|nr:fibroblast growth factor-binding protein 2 [Lacerta agilis]
MKTAAIFFVIFISFMGGLGKNTKPKKRSNGDEINFYTKVKDACTMNMSGNGEVKLRIECRSQGKIYWCEYTGNPSLCRSFNSNQRIYWNQIAMDRRKQTNACQPNGVLKPSMCQRAPPEAYMKLVASSIKPNPNLVPQADTVNQAKAVLNPAASPKQVKKSQAGKALLKKTGKPKPSPSPPPTKATQEGQVSGNDSEAMKLARKHCWESLHEFCSYIIGIFSG